MEITDKQLTYKVKDLNLADWGRRKFNWQKLRCRYHVFIASNMVQQNNHWKVLVLPGCLHMTIQTAVLIETLIELGAEVSWVHATYFQRKTMQPLPLPLPAYQYLHGREWMRKNLTGALNRRSMPSKMANHSTWSDDGGDLTNMVLDRFPELVADMHVVSAKKQLPVYTASMKE